MNLKVRLRTLTLNLRGPQVSDPPSCALNPKRAGWCLENAPLRDVSGINRDWRICCLSYGHDLLMIINACAGLHFPHLAPWRVGHKEFHIDVAISVGTDK